MATDKAKTDKAIAKGVKKENTRKDVTPKSDNASKESTALFGDLDPNQQQVFTQLLRAIKRPLSVAPTNTPQNFLQQFELYQSGATYRLYVYIGGVWRYTALT